MSTAAQVHRAIANCHRRLADSWPFRHRNPRARERVKEEVARLRALVAKSRTLLVSATGDQPSGKAKAGPRVVLARNTIFRTEFKRLVCADCASHSARYFGREDSGREPQTLAPTVVTTSDEYRRRTLTCRCGKVVYPYPMQWDGFPRRLRDALAALRNPVRQMRDTILLATDASLTVWAKRPRLAGEIDCQRCREGKVTYEIALADGRLSFRCSTPDCFDYVEQPDDSICPPPVAA